MQTLLELFWVSSLEKIRVAFPELFAINANRPFPETRRCGVQVRLNDPEL
jgi:hypothetical protein